MHRAMHRHEGRIGGLQAFDTRGPAVRGAVVENPEHAARGAVRRLAHHVGDEAVKGRDPGGTLAAAEELGPMHVERRQVGPSAPAGVLMLDPRDPAWSRRRRGVRIQNTRRAVQYGGWLITSATRRSKGAIPVVRSQRPKSLARCTSSAAR